MTADSFVSTSSCALSSFARLCQAFCASVSDSGSQGKQKKPGKEGELELNAEKPAFLKNLQLDATTGGPKTGT